MPLSPSSRSFIYKLKSIGEIGQPSSLQSGIRTTLSDLFQPGRRRVGVRILLPAVLTPCHGSRVHADLLVGPGGVLLHVPWRNPRRLHMPPVLLGFSAVKSHTTMLHGLLLKWDMIKVMFEKITSFRVIYSSKKIRMFIHNNTVVISPTNCIFHN